MGMAELVIFFKHSVVGRGRQRLRYEITNANAITNTRKYETLRDSLKPLASRQAIRNFIVKSNGWESRSILWVNERTIGA